MEGSELGAVDTGVGDALEGEHTNDAHLLVSVCSRAGGEGWCCSAIYFAVVLCHTWGELVSSQTQTTPKRSMPSQFPVSSPESHDAFSCTLCTSRGAV